MLGKKRESEILTGFVVTPSKSLAILKEENLKLKKRNQKSKKINFVPSKSKNIPTKAFLKQKNINFNVNLCFTVSESLK